MFADCQTKHWPTHKGACPGPKALRLVHRNLPTFQKIVPAGASEQVRFGYIIDTFRLRCEDDYAHGAHNHGIYGNGDPWPLWEDFLDRAETAGVLTGGGRSWNSATRERCTQVAYDDANFSIRFAVEKSDIQEHYKDPSMPMVLRMMAENIYGGGYGLGQKPMPHDFQCFC
jgi:splicing suppressor protein 51